MKKKYITPKMETTMCLLEDFIAATVGGGDSNVGGGGNQDITTETDAEHSKSKWHTAWDTWEN